MGRLEFTNTRNSPFILIGFPFTTLHMGWILLGAFFGVISYNTWNRCYRMVVCGKRQGWVYANKVMERDLEVWGRGRLFVIMSQTHPFSKVRLDVFMKRGTYCYNNSHKTCADHTGQTIAFVLVQLHSKGKEETE